MDMTTQTNYDLLEKAAETAILDNCSDIGKKVKDYMMHPGVCVRYEGPNGTFYSGYVFNYPVLQQEYIELLSSLLKGIRFTILGKKIGYKESLITMNIEEKEGIAWVVTKLERINSTKT